MPDDPPSPITTVTSTLWSEVIRTIRQLGIGSFGFFLAYYFYNKLDESRNSQDAAQEHHIVALESEVVTLQQALKADAAIIEMLNKKP